MLVLQRLGARSPARRAEGTLLRILNSAAQRRKDPQTRRTLRLKKSRTTESALFYAPYGRLKRTGLVQFYKQASTTSRASSTIQNKDSRSSRHYASKSVSGSIELREYWLQLIALDLKRNVHKTTRLNLEDKTRRLLAHSKKSARNHHYVLMQIT